MMRYPFSGRQLQRLLFLIKYSVHGRDKNCRFLEKEETVAIVRMVYGGDNMELQLSSGVSIHTSIVVM